METRKVIGIIELIELTGLIGLIGLRVNRVNRVDRVNRDNRDPPTPTNFDPCFDPRWPSVLHLLIRVRPLQVVWSSDSDS